MDKELRGEPGAPTIRAVSVQLRLFPLNRPLVERLGREFFKNAPREPGVYTMRGEADRVLYVGQSKNLRSRLAYYKNANPDRLPRRLVRLVNSVESISLERCSSPGAARQRELELLRTLRPPFNRADTGPEFCHFIRVRAEASRTRIELQFEPPSQPADQAAWMGPVRGRMIPALALAALHRLWHGAARQWIRCSELPILPRRIVSVELAGNEFTAALSRFLAGESGELVSGLLERQPAGREPALRQLQENDAETLLSWGRALQEAQ